MEKREMKHAIAIAKRFCELWEGTWVNPNDESLEMSDLYKIFKKVTESGKVENQRELLGAISALHLHGEETKANHDESEIDPDWAALDLAVSCFAMAQQVIDKTLRRIDAEYNHAHKRETERPEDARFYHGQLTGMAVVIDGVREVAKEFGLDDRTPRVTIHLLDQQDEERKNLLDCQDASKPDIQFCSTPTCLSKAIPGTSHCPDCSL
jgi:hypothetical protein